MRNTFGTTQVRSDYDIGEYVEAVQAYDKAIELNPSFAVAWYNKGRALKKQNHNLISVDVPPTSTIPHAVG